MTIIININLRNLVLLKLFINNLLHL